MIFCSLGATDCWNELHMRGGDDGGDDHKHHDAAAQRVLGRGQEDAPLLQPGLKLLQLE